MPTPRTKMTNTVITALLSTTLGNLRPYQLEQVQDVLNRFKWNRGSNSDLSVQPLISAIVTSLGTNEP